jgi:predicted secreted protein
VSLLLHLNGPYTLLFMMPINKRLMDKNVDPGSEKTAEDLKKWGKLHLVRTVLNGIIFLAFVILTVYNF